MSEWQSLENAPRDGTRILICTERNYIRNIRTSYWGRPNFEYARNKGEGWVNGGAAEPTHWMPLPPLPEMRA